MYVVDEPTQEQRKDSYSEYNLRSEELLQFRDRNVQFFLSDPAQKYYGKIMDARAERLEVEGKRNRWQ
jgi:hypothetical protein